MTDKHAQMPGEIYISEGMCWEKSDIYGDGTKYIRADLVKERIERE